MFFVAPSAFFSLSRHNDTKFVFSKFRGREKLFQMILSSLSPAADRSSGLWELVVAARLVVAGGGDADGGDLDDSAAALTSSPGAAVVFSFCCSCSCRDRYSANSAFMARTRAVTSTGGPEEPI
jgi:uncharacterized protein YbaA (DUF1428 family)